MLRRGMRGLLFALCRRLWEWLRQRAHRAVVQVPEGGDDGLRTQAGADMRRRASERRWGGERHQRRRRRLYGTQPPPIPSRLGPLEAPPVGRERLGICSSGGGIRSAAFNLGALQVLQEQRELARATYFAAVSGGSYIAAAFAMVGKAWPRGAGRPPARRRHPNNGHDDSDPQLIRDEPPFTRGSPEEQYLRNRSSYMAPDLPGKVFLLYRLVLGLVVNVALLGAPLLAAMALLSWYAYRPEYAHLQPEATASTAVPTVFVYLCVAIAALSLLAGFSALLSRVRHDDDRRAMQTWAVRLLALAALAALITIGLPEFVIWLHNRNVARATESKALFGGGSLVGLLTGALAYVREYLFTPKKAVEAKENKESVLGTKVRLTLAYLAAGLAGPLVLIGIMAWGVALGLRAPVEHLAGFPLAPALGVLLLGAFVVAYFLADIASWSLHPYYRRMLCTAFALKRVRARDGEGFTDEQIEELEATPAGRVWLARSVAVERNYDTLVRLSDTAPDRVQTPGQRTLPTLLVCAAANVSDPGATPPGRQVTSFTFSAHSVGGPLVGATPTVEMESAFNGPAADHEDPAALDYGGGPLARLQHRRARRRARDLTLPAAVAISGAALAPSMGKMTRPTLRFLLALTNVRLGVWVPNPRWVAAVEAHGGRRAAWDRLLHTRPRPIYLVKELFGRNRVDDRYLFVTDGGHYENLGLVELLRRGCTQIYCIDASGGRPNGALGDAIALARSELRVEIKLDASPLVPSQDGQTATTDAVRGSFTYEDGRKGVLVYARCVLTANLPLDIMAHHEEDPSFPHNSTIDQLYTDQKFESYRKLGECAGETAVGLMRKQG
jgi:hypothetical protein